MIKLMVITVNLGNYEYFKDLNVINQNTIDWFYITDQNFKSNIWNVLDVNSFNLPYKNNRILSKFFKMKCHTLDMFKDYDYIFWVDSSFVFENKNFVDDILNLCNNELVLYQHNSRRKEMDVYNEKERCKKLKSVDNNLLDHQYEEYKKMGFIDIKGKLYSSGIILRKNTLKINKIFEEWFEHNLNYTQRDQISLPYILWKNEIIPKVIKENINLNKLVGKKKMKARKSR